MDGHLMRIVAVLALFVAGSAAWAQNLPDPTRPPEGFDPTGQNAEAADGPVLQSTFVSSGTRHAIISGQTVAVGDKYRNAIVAEIKQGEVVLKEGSERHTLKMFPERESKTVEREQQSNKGVGGTKGRQQK
jgi:hypothetical protein